MRRTAHYQAFYMSLLAFTAGCAGEGGGVTCDEGMVLEGDECVDDDSEGGGGPGEGGAGGGSAICTHLSDEQACYGGPAGTENVGPCHAGKQVCVYGDWGPCVEDVTPSNETCNGVDEDCNGVVDDASANGQFCDTGLLGACEYGTPACVDGQSVCESAKPSAEECDNVDNDCDGQIDEGVADDGLECSSGFPGVCGMGIAVCDFGELTCYQTLGPSEEVCDDLDNNCNGQVDEGLDSDLPCSTGAAGACDAGTVACVAGVPVCNQTYAPSVESCNNLDDDCNGVIDEGCPACSDPAGVASGSLAIGPSDAVAPVCDGKVLVGNKTQNLLEMVDVTAGSVVKTWQLNNQPGDIAYDALTNTAYVTQFASNELAKVNLAAAAPTYIPLSASAHYLALGYSGIVFASQSNGGAAVIDGPGGAVLATSSISGPLIAFDGPGNQLIVGVQGYSPSSLYRYGYNPLTKKLTLTQKLWDGGGNGQNVAVSPDGDHVAFPCGGGNSAGYTILDFSSNDLTQTSGAWDTDAYPTDADFSADGTKLLATNRYDVMLFDVTTHALLMSYPVSQCSYGSLDRVAISPGGTILYAITKCGSSSTSGVLHWIVP